MQESVIRRNRKWISTSKVAEKKMMRMKNCFSVVAAFRLLRMSFSIGSVCSMWKSGWIKRKGNRKEKKAEQQS